MSSDQVPGVDLKIFKWDELQDGPLGLETMKQKLLKVGGAHAELLPFTVSAPPPYVFPEHTHDIVTWDGIAGGPGTYYITTPGGEHKEVPVEPGDILEIPAQVKHRTASGALFVLQSAIAAPCSLEKLIQSTQMLETLAHAASNANM